MRACLFSRDTGAAVAIAKSGAAARHTRLVTQIEREMLDANASLALCVHSDESFNTSDVIQPAWADVPAHMPSLLAIAGGFLAICGLILLVVRRKRA